MASVSGYLQPGEKFFIDIDMNSVEIVDVLSQIQEGQECVIANYCKALNTERS
jgi:hypothetical protein